MFYPDYEAFKRLSEKGNLIPVYKEILADLETPLSAFLKLEGKHGFLFESVEGGEKWARYSFLGSNPSMTFEVEDKTVIITRKRGIEKVTFSKDPLEVICEELKKFSPVSLKGLPRFYGGFVGYIGYDTVRFFEEIGDYGREDTGTADLFLMLTDTLLIFDNLAQKIKVVSNAHIQDENPEKSYHEAQRKISAIINKMNSPLHLPKGEPTREGAFTSNFTKIDFMESVEKIKAYIRRGDVIQTVLSQRFKKDVNVHPIQVYRALRTINPSPYMFYLDTGKVTLVGSSPEILVRLEDKRINLRPIAGTRKRGATDEEDALLEEELLADPKENAEHIMLVDLGRNDVGRVAVIGSVRLSELKTIERYSHVMHITSNVEGLLALDYDMFDLLRASFPAGTVTGAPKIRAMEIIEEFEPVKRGPYAGSVGYLSFTGNMDMCITIRTIIFKDGQAYVQAGAGIVADSDPEKEYFETVNKAKGMMKAIETAEKELTG